MLFIDILANCLKITSRYRYSSGLPGSQSVRQPEYISFGETAASMLLNGLGFNARTLHMFPGFHAVKPLDKLIRLSIEPEHINDSVLSRAWDQLFEPSVSEVYLSLAVKAIKVLKLPCKGR